MSERKTIIDTGFYCTNGVVNTPTCCGQKMKDDGGCSEGCCDDWKCEKCGKEIRVECAD